ncbi:reverse transcriptase domain-containing protein [Tanacetum coccineum]
MEVKDLPVFLFIIGGKTSERIFRSKATEVLADRSIKREEVFDIMLKEGENWMNPIREYLISGILLKDHKLAQKIIDQSKLRASSEKYTKGLAVFMQDLDQLHMEEFVWDNIICRFEEPQVIISINGKQLTEGTFPVFYKGLKIQQFFTSVYQPQRNGQVKVTNKDIIKGIERNSVKAVTVGHSTFKPGEYVLRLNSASKAEYQGKIGTTWEGTYIVVEAYGLMVKVECLFAANEASRGLIVVERDKQDVSP